MESLPSNGKEGEMAGNEIFLIPEIKKRKDKLKLSEIKPRYTLLCVGGGAEGFFCCINKRIKTEKEGACCSWHNAKTNTSTVSSLSECFV